MKVEHGRDAKDLFALVEDLGEREQGRSSATASEIRNNLTYPTRLAEHEASEEEGGDGELGGLEGDVLLVEESDLHHETRDVLRSLLLDLPRHARQPQPRLRRRVPHDPVDRRQDVTLHLDERALVVRPAAHLAQLWHRRHAIFGVLKLGRDPERRAADELVVLFEDDALRNVAVDDVEGEVERFRSKAMLLVDLDEEVDEVGAHVPLELGLLVDKVDRGGSFSLARREKGEKKASHHNQLRVLDHASRKAKRSSPPYRTCRS